MKKFVLGAVAVTALAVSLNSCGDNAECSSYRFDFVDGTNYNFLRYTTATEQDSINSVITFVGCEEEVSAGFFNLGSVTVPFIRDKETVTFLNKTYAIEKETRSKLTLTEGTMTVVFTKAD